MILLRWRCNACDSPWASSMPGETRCPFCGSQDITETPAQIRAELQDLKKVAAA